MMSKILDKHITALDYERKILLLFSGTCSGVSLYLFTTAISTPIGLASASISLVFFISNGIIEMFLNLMKRKINKHRLNGIEKNV